MRNMSNIRFHYGTMAQPPSNECFCRFDHLGFYRAFFGHKGSQGAPIERKTAELATATAISDAGKTIVDSAMAINEKMAEQSVRLNDEIKVLRDRVCLWERWHNNLRDTWDTVRTNEHAPDGPDHLEVDNDRVG